MTIFRCLIQCLSPDHLRCSYVNVAAAAYGGQCNNASHNSASCGLVIDRDTATKWEGNGGVGQWVKMKLAREYLINTIRVMQKSSATDQIKGLRLEFSDGSEAFVSSSKGCLQSWFKC